MSLGRCLFFDFFSGVESKFGVSVGRMEWLEKDNSWLLLGINGQSLGQFEGVVASDKNIVSPRFTNVTGRVPPLGTLLVRSHLVMCCKYLVFSFFIVRATQFDSLLFTEL